MAQAQMLQIKLSRFDAQPWGFRLQGGVDFAAPLLVQKVNGGSLAENAGLLPGDAVIQINDVDVYNLRHKDAQDIIVRSGNNFVITVQRGGSTWRPLVTPTGQLPQSNSPYLQTVTKTSLAHKQPNSQHIGCGYNNAAKPFGNGVDGNVKSIVNKQYNTPVGIYSDESIAETLSAQAEVLAGGVLGVNFKKNEKEYQAEKSEVLKFLREEESGPNTPAFNNHTYEDSQQYGQQQHHNYQQQQLTTRHVNAPVTQQKPPNTGGLPTGQNICCECERLITGVFVRIRDKNLHVECFKCATCGTSLKNQGYYNFNNKLYCDIHAKLAALQNPPSGTEGYVPVPIKPNTKLSASTISSALNAHGYNISSNNGTLAPVAKLSPTANTTFSSNLSIVDKTQFNNNSDSSIINNTSNSTNNEMSTTVATGHNGDKPFEYVTLTGNVIRSVVPPGKGNVNYKVNQGGYARPYSAVPPAAAPKSPVSYPPQPQQWNQPLSNQPKPSAVNAYATLPRSSAGQQENLIKPFKLNDTLPCKTNANPKTTASVANASLQFTDLSKDDPTVTLDEPVGKVNMGKKAENVMDEACKVISNMLEARLTKNANSMPLPYSNSSLSLRSNSSSNFSRSPMMTRKRLDQYEFKDSSVTGADVLKLTETVVGGLPPPESVIYRNSERSNRRASHETDRRSYMETNAHNDQFKDGAVFSISVNALGKPVADHNKPLTLENGELVSQLLKDGKQLKCCQCNCEIMSGPFITALGKIWCPEHFHCVNGNCRRPLQDIGFVEEKGDLYCEYCFEKYLAPTCSKCAGKIKGDCLNAIGKHFHPECFACGHCGKLFGNTPFFLEDGMPYCEADWNELFTTKCFACGFPVEAGDRWVEALNHNYHSQCFNCTYCKQNLEGQSFYNKGGRPFCKNHAR